jgi:hypothetical protein
MSDFLFSVPWYLPTVLGIIGLAVMISGNRRQNPRLRSAGLTIIALAIGWAVMSYLVDTPKETCQKQSRRFVQSVVDRDWKTFNDLMAPDVDFKFAGTSWQIAGKDTLSVAVKADVEQIGLKSATITDARAAETGSTVTVTMKVWSNQEISMERPIDSEWDFDWRESNGKWLLHEIRAIRVTGLNPDQVRGSLHVR